MCSYCLESLAQRRFTAAIHARSVPGPQALVTEILWDTSIGFETPLSEVFD